MADPWGVLSTRYDSGHHPWGVLAAGLAATTTEVGDVDGRPPGGCCQQGPTTVTTEVEDVDGGIHVVPELKVRERPPSM
jgi:hypothetical protein